MENKDNERAPAPRRSARIPKVQQQAAARAAAQAEAEAEAEAARQPKRRRTNASAKATSATAPRTATKRATSGPSRRRGRQQLVNEPAAQRQIATRPGNQPQNPVYQPQIQPATEAAPQPGYQQPAPPQQQVQDQYQTQYQQETQHVPQAHHQQPAPLLQQVPDQYQAQYQQDAHYAPQTHYQQVPQQQTAQHQQETQYVPQTHHQQPAHPLQQVPDQYQAQYQQETQHAPQAHHQQAAQYQQDAQYAPQTYYQQVPQQQQAPYHHQAGYPREPYQPGYQYQLGHQHEAQYQYGPGYQYGPAYPPQSQPANPPPTPVIPAPVHTAMDHYPQPQPEYHTGYETVQQQPLPTINQPAPHTSHAAYQTIQQGPLPSVHQLVHLGVDATYYDQTGVEPAPSQQPPQPPVPPVPAPAGNATYQNAQQTVQQPVAQPAHQLPPQPVAQAAEEAAGQPTGEAERQVAEEDNRRANVRIPKRKRFPIYHWTRSMGWPAEHMGARGIQNEGEEAPTYRFDEIRDLARRTVSGFTGPLWSNYNMPNGGDMLTPEKQSEVPTGCPIDRWTRDRIYDQRAVDYLNKWHCCFDDKSTGPDNDESTGPDSDEKDFCLRLLEKKCPTPSGTLFDPGDFQYICERAILMNEVEMFHLIGDLIVPQAEIAVRRGQVTGTDALKDRFCEPWVQSIPFDEQSTRLSQRLVRNMESTGYLLPIPQPDRTVGFSQGAFSAKQHRRLAAQTRYDDGFDKENPVSFFNGPLHMFFPFLTTEVKPRLSFEPAERENAHNMAVAMKGIVTLFKRGDPKKLEELNRKVLGFSISHTSERVKIHAHYPIIEGEKATYHRWCIRDFKWTSEADKWQAYKFVMAVYNHWAPRHLKRLHSAIDGLPLEDQINMSLSSGSIDSNGQMAVASPDLDVPDVDVDKLKQLVQAVKDHREREGIHYTPENSEVPQA